MERLMYLIDTNIFLEGLLEQEKAESVRYFFQAVDIEKTFMTDLALHSIGIILFRLEKYELFTSFVEDMIINGMEILSSPPEDLMKLDSTAQQYNLDFDDAYQYMLAEKHQLQLISFDKDFDSTKIGRKELKNSGTTSPHQS
jgi:predicted nucleic acid-binding protein